MGSFLAWFILLGRDRCWRGKGDDLDTDAIRFQSEAFFSWDESVLLKLVDSSGMPDVGSVHLVQFSPVLTIDSSGMPDVGSAHLATTTLAKGTNFSLCSTENVLADLDFADRIVLGLGGTEALLAAQHWLGPGYF